MCRKVHTCHVQACKQYIWQSYNKSTISTLSPVHFDRNPFLCSCEGGEGLNDFRSGAFTGHFQSDGAESMAVKGLSCWSCLHCLFLMKLTLCIRQHFKGSCLGHFHCGLHFNFDIQWWVSIVIIAGSWKTDIQCCTGHWLTVTQVHGEIKSEVQITEITITPFHWNWN